MLVLGAADDAVEEAGGEGKTIIGEGYEWFFAARFAEQQSVFVNDELQDVVEFDGFVLCIGIADEEEALVSNIEPTGTGAEEIVGALATACNYAAGIGGGVAAVDVAVGAKAGMVAASAGLAIAVAIVGGGGAYHLFFLPVGIVEKVVK